jgi:hypothetical protein
MVDIGSVSVYKEREENYMKLGIIQSRGLGDIVIALPIARYYWNRGNSIHWPVLAEWREDLLRAVPWVDWRPIEGGEFFYEEPLRLLEDCDERICLYQYLSSHPELTDPELFSILKFDQYKYWVAEVPFLEKWKLQECIVRDPVRERELKEELGARGDYAVVHRRGSDFYWEGSVEWTGLPTIEIAPRRGWSIFDWLGVLEEAKVYIGVDSVFSNLVDSLDLVEGDRYWIRRSAWDLTPVLGGQWTIIESPGWRDPVRVDPVAEVRKKNG